MQRFVDASIIGWANYLYGDNRPRECPIKRDNPGMTDALMAYSIATIKQYGIVDSGDTLRSALGSYRCADEKLLRQDGRCRRGQASDRLRSPTAHNS